MISWSSQIMNGGHGNQDGQGGHGDHSGQGCYDGHNCHDGGHDGADERYVHDDGHNSHCNCHDGQHLEILKHAAI